jgi:uncharacterized protein DUF3106
MRTERCQIPRVLVVVFLGGMATISFPAGQGAAIAGQQSTPEMPALPPAPPPPIDFRKLLAMNSSDREKILASRTEQQRQVVLSKIGEFESLSPKDREARLCAVQLQLHLRPLLQVPSAKRLDRLAMIPEPDRKPVEDRLKFWDQLPREVQREFLTNEWLLRYVFRSEPPLPAPALKLPNSLQERIEKGIESWNRLPESKRQEILGNFQELFELSESEKAKVLNEFTEAERQRMQRTLQTFERLPKAQRERCLNGFQKFAGLSVQERQQFLSNVALWESMSSADRQAWQALVRKIATIQPPIPMEFDAPPLPPPAAPKLPNWATNALSQ